MYKSMKTIKMFGAMLLMIFLVGIAVSHALAQAGQATFSEIEGQVEARAEAESQFELVSNGDLLEPGGSARTGDNGKARLLLADGSIVRMGNNSEMELGESSSGVQGLMHQLWLEFGQLWIILSGQALQVDTPSGVASVRGSFMSVYYDPETEKLYITCLEGECSVSQNGNTVLLTAGQTATVTGTASPVVGLMSPADFEDWLTNNPEAGPILLQLTPTPPAAGGGLPGAPGSGGPAWPVANDGEGTTPKPQRVTTGDGCSGLNTLTGRVQICSAEAGAVISAAPLDSRWLGRLPGLGSGLSFGGEGLIWWADPDPGTLSALICFPNVYPDQNMSIYSLSPQGYWFPLPTTLQPLSQNGINFLCTESGPGTDRKSVV